MSLSAIQDNLAKVPLVQQTQTKGDDVARGQEIGQSAAQREQNRQEDQVVIHSKESENQGLRTDEEREKEGRKKKRGDQDPEKDGTAREEDHPDDSDLPAQNGPREVMRRINIII
ncbi:MAG: hypothetical protein LIP77_02735 [Planctomycetes bacterium]|nr:hypothetical protein [Planctomycetota bacterium]